MKTRKPNPDYVALIGEVNKELKGMGILWVQADFALPLSTKPENGHHKVAIFLDMTNSVTLSPRPQGW